MSRRSSLILMLVLALTSVLLYGIHYMVFKDAHHVFIYLLGDIAFVPIEVLMVTLVIHRAISLREKARMLKKLNMIIGIFFSEVGIELISFISSADRERDEIASGVEMRLGGRPDFKGLKRMFRSFHYSLDPERIDFAELKRELSSKRGFLIRLLENQNLLEHESFTEMLWAVFHLVEELQIKKDPARINEEDTAHLMGDINRFYRLLVFQWLIYMEHLHSGYPYLFSLALRSHPYKSRA